MVRKSNLIFILAIMLLTGMFTNCKKETNSPETDPTAENQQKRLTGIMHYNMLDILTNGELYEYDTLNNLSRIIVLSEGEVPQTFEELEYNNIDFLDIVTGSVVYDTASNVLSNVEYHYLTQNDTLLLEEKLVLGDNGFYFLEKENFEYTINNKVRRHYYSPNPTVIQWDSVFTYGPSGKVSSFEFVQRGMSGTVLKDELRNFKYNENGEIQKETINLTTSTFVETEIFFYEYKYGSAGKLSEVVKTNSLGSIVSRTEHIYNSYENSVKISQFSGGGDLRYINKFIYDDDRNLIEEEYKAVNPSDGYTKKYLYELY
ncbi:MAG: hypothetical protein JEZ03_04710 [Bacteroidales bacterium]|nr:hypothetical protein [Bacteroidales bacterium]